MSICFIFKLCVIVVFFRFSTSSRPRRKVEMQHINMSNENQDMVKEMLLALHVPSALDGHRQVIFHAGNVSCLAV